MIGIHGISVSEKLIGKFGFIEGWMTSNGILFDGFYHNGIFSNNPYVGLVWIVALMFISLCFPNVSQIVHKYHYKSKIYSSIAAQKKSLRIQWRPNFYWSIFISLIFVTSILGLTQVSEFLYFQF
jgi:hypothetical protein